MSGYSKTNDVLGSENRDDPNGSRFHLACRAGSAGVNEAKPYPTGNRGMLVPPDPGTVT